MGSERTVGVFSRRDGVERIIVVEREDGLFTYRKQAAGQNGVWSHPGPACGVYDTSDTAIAEAKHRVWWMTAAAVDAH